MMNREMLLDWLEIYKKKFPKNPFKVKNFFETKHQVKAQKVQFPLMNRAYELWGLTGFSDSTFVRIV